jgi:zinc protease
MRRRTLLHLPLARGIAVLVLLAAPGLLSPEASHAQDPEPDWAALAAALSPDDDLPPDPRLSTGMLSNGLRYYIQENDRPADRAELRLVVNVGSIVEDEDQRGLAHFLEHMAFNGTENFEKQALVDYMESIGMRMGAGVNASTSFDETTYILRVPTDSAGPLETAMQVLEDWAHGLALDPEEIDAERGVVIEEWRLGQGAGARVREQHYPALLRDSRYRERLPIGEVEVLENFEHEALRRFYDTWYRPDLMAVVAVGDFDGEYVEGLVREHFSNVPARPDAPSRPTFSVPDHAETLVAVATDPELTGSSVSVNYKKPPPEPSSVARYRASIVQGFFDSMLNQRLAELTLDADPPFLGASSGLGRLTRTKGIYAMNASVDDDGLLRGLDAVLTEAERVARHGFTEAELERVKTTALRGMERSFEASGTASSASFVGQYIGNYLVGSPMAHIGLRYQLYRRFVPGISLEEVNARARELITAENRVILAAVPEKEGLEPPTEAQLLAVFERVAESEIAPYEDTSVDQPLIATLPEPGSIVAERTVDTVGVTEWTLSNGVVVALKPTDFTDDQILMRSFSPGGTSLLSDEDVLRASASLINASGVGEFGPLELRRKLTGKVASASASVGSLEEGVSGSASPQDLETMFQLLHLRFTAPRADSTVFLAGIARARASFENRQASPAAAYSDTIQATMTQGHPRSPLPSLETIEATDLDYSLEVYRDRFSDASDFTFVFVGDFDLETMRPLIERYVASLPATGREESWRDVGSDPPTGVIEKEVYRGLEPQSQSTIIFTGPFDYARQNRTATGAMTSILQTMLRDRVREELGGSYGVGVSNGVSWRPEETYSITIRFGSDPERVEELTDVVFDGIRQLQTEGPSAEDLASTKEALRRSRESNLESNAYWATQLVALYQRGEDPASIWGYVETIDAMTPEMIRDAAARHFDLQNYVRVTLFPESMRQGMPPATRPSNPDP